MSEQEHIYEATAIGDDFVSSRLEPPTVEIKNLSLSSFMVEYHALKINGSFDGKATNAFVFIDGQEQRKLRKVVLTLEVGEAPTVQLTRIVD